MAINVEIHLDHLQISQNTHFWINEKINRLEEGHHDISGAHLSIKQLSGKPTVNHYEARLILYHKPDHIVGSHKSTSITDAVQEVLTATERQLRKARSTNRDRRKRATGNYMLPE